MEGSYPPTGGRRFESGPRYKAIRQRQKQSRNRLLFVIYTLCIPSDIPSNPNSTYKTEWKGVGDFLGKE